MDADDLTQSLWQSEKSGNESARDCVDKFGAVFRLIGLTNKGKVGVFVPDVLGQI